MNTKNANIIFKEGIMIDRDTALAILKDLSSYMQPSYDLFGRKTLVIDRDQFELIRKKYLDRKVEYYESNIEKIP